MNAHFNSHKALYVFSGDPITYGHFDIVERVSRIFPHVCVGIGENPDKAYLFTLDERLDMARHVLAHLPNVSVEAYRGLTVDYAAEQRIPVIVKGVRNEADADYERTLHEIGESQKRNIETLLLFAKPELRSVSSSAVKALQKEYGDVHTLVPLYVKQKLEERISQQFILGITGEIGVGKSYVANRLVEEGQKAYHKPIPIHNIELDRIGHEVLSTRAEPLYQETREKIVERFGAHLRVLDGSIDRQALGEIVFNDAAAMQALNALMYEPIMLRLRRERAGKKGIILINVALLAESGISHVCNHNVLLVRADTEVQAARLQRRGLTQEQIARRRASQYTTEHKRKALQEKIAANGHGKIYECINHEDNSAHVYSRLFYNIESDIRNWTFKLVEGGT